MTRNQIPHTEDPQVTYESEYKNSNFIKLDEDGEIFIEMKYPQLGLKYAENDCLLRIEAYEKLMIAQNNLPHGYHIKIWDAWRSFSLQEELFHVYYQQIVKNIGIENASDEEKINTVKKYVSIPRKLEFEYPVHASGGAIDVTLADCNGKDIYMGTEFDEMVPAAQTDYYENSGDEEIKMNRRILYHAMISADFTNLPSEWWHYDYGDRFWAFYKKKPINYSAIYEREGVRIEKQK